MDERDERTIGLVNEAIAAIGAGDLQQASDTLDQVVAWVAISAALSTETADRLAAMMWLEYAMEGDEYCEKATGLNANLATNVAYGLLPGASSDARKWSLEQHAKHKAEHAIENAQYMARGGPTK